MRILFITRQFNPSTAADSKRVSGLTRYFASQGNEVYVISNNIEATSDHENIHVIPTKPVGRDSVGMLERLINHSCFTIKTIIKGRKLKNIDVVISTTPPSFNMISGKYLARKLKAKYVVDIRDIWPEVFEQTDVMSPSNIVYKFFNYVSKKSYKAADLIGVVTPGKKKYLDTKYPQYKDKIKFVSNGFNSEILDNETIEEMKVNFEGNINVIYTGKIGLAQDLTNLINLANDFKYISNLKFHLFGSGRGVEELKSLIASKSLNNIEFYGYRTEQEITSAISFSQIAFVSLGNEKLIDSIPTKMYEAMLFGCPILLSAKGDSVDLLNEFDFGKSSLPKDYDTLKSNFEYLIKNNDKYKAKGSQVIDGLMKKYSREVVAQQYLDYIDKL